MSKAQYYILVGLLGGVLSLGVLCVLPANRFDRGNRANIAACVFLGGACFAMGALNIVAHCLGYHHRRLTQSQVNSLADQSRRTGETDAVVLDAPDSKAAVEGTSGQHLEVTTVEHVETADIVSPRGIILPQGRTMKLLYTLFSFQGRIGRGKFWAAYLISMLMLLGIEAVTIEPAESPELIQPAIRAIQSALESFDDHMIHAIGFYPFMCVVIIFFVALIWIYYVMNVRRLPALGHSGIPIFCNLIPIIGYPGMLVYLGCFRGTRGPNKYGADPSLPQTSHQIYPDSSPHIPRSQ